MTPRADLRALSLIVTGRTSGLAWDSFTAVEWEQLIMLARAEGVAPLLYWTLSKSGSIPSHPGAVHDLLHDSYAATWVQNQKILRELELLTERLDDAGIPAVALKGACFALTIYEDPGLRPMGDLDLLVPVHRLGEAIQIAGELGYEDAAPEASIGLNNLLNHATCLIKRRDRSILLELHHRLVGTGAFTYAVPMDWFWDQIEPLGGAFRERYGSLHMLSPTAQVLYAGAHAALQHGGKNAGLRWYYDIDHLIRFYGERMDWDLLLSQAGIFGWASALEASLTWTRAYFDSPVPDHVLTHLAVQSDRNKKRVQRLQARPATHTLDELHKLASLKGFGRFRLALALVAPSPAYMRWRYSLQPSRSLSAAYFLRWWGIVKDLIRTLLHLFRLPLQHVREP
jgi:hypothetical protein